MKKALLLKPMLLLCALIVGSGTMWGQVSTATATNAKQFVVAYYANSKYYALPHGTTASVWDGTEITLNSINKVNTNTASNLAWTLTEGSTTGQFYLTYTSNNNTYYLYKNGQTSSTNYNIKGTTNTSERHYWEFSLKNDNNVSYYTVKSLKSGTGDATSIYLGYETEGKYGVYAQSNAAKIILLEIGDVPAFTLTAESNNTLWGTVSVSGNKITANPATGYRISTTTPYTVTSGSATVTQNENVFTVTASAACTVRINFEEGPKYQVSFNAQAGTCTTSSLTESVYQGGVTLPAATINVNGWVFAGWATATVSNTSTRPTLYKANTTYYPKANITLYAVYTLDGIDGEKYTRAKSLSQITSAGSVIFVNASKVLDNALGSVTAPTETNDIITPADNIVWNISGDNTNGYTLTNSSNSTLGVGSLPSNYANVELSTNNNKWIFASSTSGDNHFILRNKNLNTSNNWLSLRFYGSNTNKWQVYAQAQSTAESSSVVASNIYVPVETAYNSNPSAITTPTVAFASSDDKTLYLDGTTTYTNAATVTGVSKTITYTSSDTNVATVDDGGKVTAVGIGEATITASVDAELGVSASASATYDVVVKTTTTINGLKPLSSTSAEVNFSADLTDAVVTYVSGDYAYIQDATAAIMVNYSGHGLSAGQKINGAVSGKVKAPNQIDQISSLNLEYATVTNDGVIPAATVATLATIKAAGTNYDGKLVVVNGATVTTGMTNTTSGGKISDDNGTTTFNIIAPNTLTLVANEKGNFTGFVSIYVSGSNTTYRLNIYEEGQFVKTHNAPTAQTLTFASDAVELDEDTEDYTSFDGQQVSGAQGTVSYAKTSDTDNIITSLNTETGTVVLSGAYGTATITATAAATEVTESGVTTPYNETTKSYTITVYPRYSVVFSINGVETTVRQATHGESIAVVSKPEDIGAYKFQGWVENEVAAGSSKPDNYVALSNTYTPTANKTFYAVYALEAVLPDVEQTSTFSFSSNSSSSAVSYVNGEISWSSSGAVGSTGLLSQSLTFTPSKNVSSVKGIKLSKNGNAWKNAVFVTLKAADNTEIFKIFCGTETNNFTDNEYSHNLTNYQSTSYTLASNGNAWLSTIEVTYLAPGFEYSDYRTSITVPESTSATIAASGYTTFCSPYDLSFENVDGLEAAYVVSASTNAVATLKKVTAVPGGTGVVLKGSAGAVTIPVEEYTGDEISNLLLGTLKTTTVTARSVYVISEGKFKIYTGTSIPAGKAYLPISAVSSDGNAPSLSFEFDDETTSIENVNRAIINDNQYYTLDGRRVETPSKGLYIINGKKVVVK